jgi:LemA protein
MIAAAQRLQAMEGEVTSIVSRIRIVLPAVALGLTLSACGYNTIPTLEEQAKARWADVQNQYQRRADLIPNLVATVQGYAAQEKNVLTAVVEARAKATQDAVAYGACATSAAAGAGAPRCA